MQRFYDFGRPWLATFRRRNSGRSLWRFHPWRLAILTNDPLTKSQAKTIRDGLFPGFNYLYRLRQRMEKAGFPSGDKLFQLVCAAYDAAHRLNVEVHYLSCDGVGRPAK